MDPDIEIVLRHYKHLFPEFSLSHAIVYKILWRIHPMQVEDIVKETRLSNATVCRTIHDLLTHDLIKRTSFKPVGYYAQNPIKDYNSHMKKILTKLEKGAEQLESLIENSTGLSGEIYLVQKDGGQQKLIIKETREGLNKTEQLLLIKRAVDEQLKEVDKQKLRTTAVYR